MNQELTTKSGIRKIMISGILYLVFFLSTIFISTRNVQAQSYAQIPAAGGIASPVATPTFNYGLFSSLNVRSAILYPASDLISISTPVSISSLGFKLVGSTSGGTQGIFKIYVIPTTDAIKNLSSNWSSIMQHPDIIEVYNSVFMTFSPITGYLDFNLTTPFTLQPGQGFYLVTDWDQGILPGMNATYDCNTALSNSYQFGFNNSHSPQTTPTTLTTSSNYRPVLRLGNSAGPTGITKHDAQLAITVYPNPAQEILHVDLGKFEGSKIQATLRDVTGKIIRTEKLSGNKNQLSLKGIPTGIYSLQLSNETETVVKKIVKQ